MTERQVEIPWAIQFSEAPILDVGCAESSYLGHLDAPVDGIDVRPVSNPHLRNFFLGDIRDFAFSGPYRTVLVISTVEHIGLGYGPYGTESDEVVGGDRTAVLGCWDAVAPGGKLMISVPFGAQRNYEWFRQYDLDGLSELMGYLFFSVEIWVRGENDEWWEVRDLDKIDIVEQLEYDFDGGSARAVALITAEKHEA